MGVVLPSIRTETCLDLSDSTLEITHTTISAYVD